MNPKLIFALSMIFSVLAIVTAVTVFVLIADNEPAKPPTPSATGDRDPRCTPFAPDGFEISATWKDGYRVECMNRHGKTMCLLFHHGTAVASDSISFEYQWDEP